MEWIRTGDLSKVYPISRSHGFELLQKFKKETDPKNVIKDGRITIIRKDAFEEWWRNRSV